MIFKWALFGTFFASYIGEDGNRWNHLYEWHDQNGTPYHISFQADKPINPINVRSLKVECKNAYGVDEKASDKFNRWISYKAYICVAWELKMSDKKIIILNKDLKEEHENKKEEKKESFEEIMKKNAEKKKKAAEERLKANKSVLKSYRIK